MIADMLSNKNLNPIVTELFIKGKKVFFLFLLQALICCTKNVRLNSTHYFIMKIPSKRELQQIAFNYLSDIDSKDFLNVYKKYTAKSCCFWWLVLLLYHIIKIIWKLIIAFDDKIRDQKLQYDINRIAAKISSLLSGKIDKNEYPTGEGLLPSDQSRIVEQRKFTYSPLVEALGKQGEPIKVQVKKANRYLESIKSWCSTINNERWNSRKSTMLKGKNGIKEIKKIEKDAAR